MIELIGVGVRRGAAQVLDGLFLAAEPGQVVLISGPRGGGKSTLLDLLCGRAFADEGSVRVFDHEVGRLRAGSLALLRRRVALTPQEILLLEDRSALANVAVALEVAGLGRAELRRRAAGALAVVGLGPEVDRPVAELSGGARRLVSLARALATDPDVLLADEPSADLDQGSVELLVELFERMRGAGRIVFVASSDPRLLAASRLGSWRHLALEDGQLVPGDLDITIDEAFGEIVPFPTPVRASASGGASS